MFKNCKNTREQGDVGLSGAIYHYTAEGYRCLLPLTDNSPYDLVIEKDDVFLKVQVKTTRSIRYNSYAVQIKSVRPNRTKSTIKGFDNKSCDLLFVLTEDGTMYSIPAESINSKTELLLGNKQKKFKCN